MGRRSLGFRLKTRKYMVPLKGYIGIYPQGRRIEWKRKWKMKWKLLYIGLYRDYMVVSLNRGSLI